MYNVCAGYLIICDKFIVVHSPNLARTTTRIKITTRNSICSSLNCSVATRTSESKLLSSSSHPSTCSSACESSSDWLRTLDVWLTSRSSERHIKREYRPPRARQSAVILVITAITKVQRLFLKARNFVNTASALAYSLMLLPSSLGSIRLQCSSGCLSELKCGIFHSLYM